MTITIPEDIRKESGLSERELLIEFACRLFDAERMEFHTARRLSGLERVEFEIELRKRNLAICHVTQEHWEQDLRTIERLKESA